MRPFTLMSALVLFGLPAVTHGQVLLSEIAWMGTDADPTHEWIELYNFSNTPTDLSGWTLATADGNVSVALSGTLAPHAVVLLERDTDLAVPEVAAALTYAGELSDTGTVLTVTNSEGSVSDQADGTGSWSTVGGTNTSPKKTAQRTRMGTWVTAAPTPGLDNAQVDDPVTGEETPGDTTNPTPTPSRSGGGSSRRSAARSEFSATIVASTTAYVGKPASFTATYTGVNKKVLNTLSYYWNFGDLETSTTENPEHVYAFPGEYVVTLEASTSRKQAFSRFDVTVLSRALSLSATSNNDVVITSETADEIVLDGYRLVAEEFELVFPKNSILRPKAAITIPSSKIGSATSLKLLDTENDVVAELSIVSQKGTTPQAATGGDSTVLAYTATRPPVQNVVVQNVVGKSDVASQARSSARSSVAQLRGTMGATTNAFNLLCGTFPSSACDSCSSGWYTAQLFRPFQWWQWGPASFTYSV